MYSPYLSDNSFGLGLTWSLLGHEDCEAKQGQSSLHPKREQQTECFTMAHAKGKLLNPTLVFLFFPFLSIFS